MNNLIVKEEGKETAVDVRGVDFKKKDLGIERVESSKRRSRDGGVSSAPVDKVDSLSNNRVVITKDANSILESLVSRTGEGFEAGTITKSDVANYVFLNLQKFFSESDMKALRTIHFDEKKVLSSFLKSENDLPEELKKAIRLHYGLTEKDKKKSSKPLSDLSTE